ncbi:hypothetical protein LCGC14_2748240 [marine sediment metagenome]|uniref:Uncharacterized protein n=1 Tax=marine sediment metagenome TaxID=412755 RepID=A0A0F8ZPM2_9ZZZZ
MSEKEEMKTCEEEYPIGTEVIIIEDCRRFKRATGKKGVIVKYMHYIIPAANFPLNLGKGKEKIELTIDNLEEDLQDTMPIIKYGKLAKIRGYQCFWSSIEDFEKMKKLKNNIEKEVSS